MKSQIILEVNLMKSNELDRTAISISVNPRLRAYPNNATIVINLLRTAMLIDLLRAVNPRGEGDRTYHCDQAYLTDGHSRLCKVWFCFLSWERIFVQPEFETDWIHFTTVPLCLEYPDVGQIAVRYVGNAVRGHFLW